MIFVAVAVIVATFAPPHVAAFVAGLIVGHYATPDVRDQHQVRAHTEHLIDRQFGRMVGRLWTMIWWLPARLIPHRHWASHLPGPATLIAAAWLWWLPMTLLWVYSPQWFTVVWILKWWHIAGWVVQDVIHLAQDDWRIRW